MNHVTRRKCRLQTDLFVVSGHSYANAWTSLGVAYDELNRYNDAIKAYRRAIKIDPKNAVAWNNLGVAYSLSGDRAAAIDAVRELRRLDPTRADKLDNWIMLR